jgi:hypothetical protein
MGETPPAELGDDPYEINAREQASSEIVTDLLEIMILYSAFPLILDRERLCRRSAGRALPFR